MKKNAHDSRAIANIFVGLWQNSSDAPLTVMALLKYVYFAHGWTLGHTGKPLICHTVEAWKHGPVVPEVYRAFRPQSSFNITKMVEGYSLKDGALSGSEQSIVEGVYREYSPLPPTRLSKITHAKGTPWYRYRHTFYGEIPDSEIERYYKEMVARLEEKQ